MPHSSFNHWAMRVKIGIRTSGVSGPSSMTVKSRMLDGAKHLVQSLDKAPALIFVCGPVCYPPQAPQESAPAAPQEPGEHKQPTAPLPQVPPAPDDPGSGPLGLPQQHTEPAAERLDS